MAEVIDLQMFQMLEQEMHELIDGQLEAPCHKCGSTTFVIFKDCSVRCEMCDEHMGVI